MNTQNTDDLTSVVYTETYGDAWNMGEGLWWRDNDGLHGVVLVREPSFGPKGARLSRGLLAEFTAPTLEDLNKLLAERGWGPLALPIEEIAWHGK